MSTLIIKPNPEVFSKIPLLEDTVDEFNAKNTVELIQNVGDVFVKHNMYDKFGLSLLHRHLDLSEQEILVESIRQDRTLSVFVPWKFTDELSTKPSDENLWKSYGMEDSHQKYVVPQHWFFTPEGNVVPFEYLATDEQDFIEAPNQEFVRELFEALSKLGVEKLVGLRSTKHIKGTSTWEFTKDNIRASVVTLERCQKTYMLTMSSTFCGYLIQMENCWSRRTVAEVVTTAIIVADAVILVEFAGRLLTLFFLIDNECYMLSETVLPAREVFKKIFTF